MSSQLFVTTGWTSTLVYINDDVREQRDSLQKNVRYFVSHEQSVLLKVHEDGREEHLEKNYTVTVFNRVINKPMSEYKVNYSYYINEAMKIINNVDDGQLKLF